MARRSWSAVTLYRNLNEFLNAEGLEVNTGSMSIDELLSVIEARIVKEAVEERDESVKRAQKSRKKADDAE